MNNLNVQHDVINHLFFTKVKGGMAVLNYNKLSDKHLDYAKTHVPDDSRGMGVGKHLVEFALDYAKQRDITIVPSCPFVKSVIEESNKYESLVRE